jgi:CRISPR/Cas system endoribonuclease Cas6 (RAMP superfamily)
VIFAVSMFAVSDVISAVTLFAVILFAVTSFAVVSHRVVVPTTCRFQSIVTFPPNSISVVHRARLEKSHWITVQLDNSKEY